MKTKSGIFLVFTFLGVLSSLGGYSQLKAQQQRSYPQLPDLLTKPPKLALYPCMPGFTFTNMTVEACVEGHVAAGYEPPPSPFYISSYACIPTEDLMEWCTSVGGLFELIESGHYLLCLKTAASEGELGVFELDCPPDYQRAGFACAPNKPSYCKVPAGSIPIELSITGDGYCCLGTTLWSGKQLFRIPPEKWKLRLRK